MMNWVTSLRSRRSRAGRNSLGKRQWRVRRRGFWGGWRGFGGAGEVGGGNPIEGCGGRRESRNRREV